MYNDYHKMWQLRIRGLHLLYSLVQKCPMATPFRSSPPPSPQPNPLPPYKQTYTLLYVQGMCNLFLLSKYPPPLPVDKLQILRNNNRSFLNYGYKLSSYWHSWLLQICHCFDFCRPGWLLLRLLPFSLKQSTYTHSLKLGFRDSN